MSQIRSFPQGWKDNKYWKPPPTSSNLIPPSNLISINFLSLKPLAVSHLILQKRSPVVPRRSETHMVSKNQSQVVGSLKAKAGGNKSISNATGLPVNLGCFCWNLHLDSHKKSVMSESFNQGCLPHTSPYHPCMENIPTWMVDLFMVNVQLVGGWTNPFEKICSSKWESSPNRGENKKYLKPPPREYR